MNGKPLDKNRVRLTEGRSLTEDLSDWNIFNDEFSNRIEIQQ